MSWWRDGEKVLGDGPLDFTEEFLRSVTSEYLEEQGRRPTLDELLTTLSLVLGRGTAEFVDDGESIQVTQVMARTTKRSTVRLEPGDVFAVPLGNGRVVFGRLTPQHSFAEFFDGIADEGDDSGKWCSAPIIRFPFLVDLTPLESQRWKIVGRTPHQDGEFVPQHFVVGGQVSCGDKVVNGFVDVSTQLRPWNASDKDLPKMSVANEAYLIETLRRRLGSK